MSRFLRFFRVIGVIIACVFGAIVPRAGYADTTYPFTVTTEFLSVNTTFTFAISAAGTFYVDWGDGSAEQTIAKSDTNVQEISHTYVTAGTYTIGLRGLATGYNSDDLVPAISFGYLPDGYLPDGDGLSARYNIASVSGSLGAIFPTIGTNVPSFASAFANCYLLTSIPGTLFSGVTGARPHMFDFTFYNNAISEIPENLFSGISGAAESMFSETFIGCHNLMFLPNGLFSGISGTASRLFESTFYDCSSLTGYIPKNLFNFGTGGLTYNASNSMMGLIFGGTNLATSCDSYGMERYTSDFDSYFDGKVVCQMPNVNVTFSCEMPTNVPGYWIGGGTAPSSISAPITSGNVTFTFPDGANCNGGDYGTKLNAWTCDAAICNNRTWPSNGTAVFNEPWDGSAELHFHMVYEPAVFSVSLDEDRYWYDDSDGSYHSDTTPVAGNVTTLYEKYGFGWSTNPNGPFTTNLTLSASDLPTVNGFEFGGWYTVDQYDTNDPANFGWGWPIVGDTGHVVSPVESIGSVFNMPRLVANWKDVNTNVSYGISLYCGNDGVFAQNFNGTSTFSLQSGMFYGEAQYGDNIVVPSKNACEREGYYYNQWFAPQTGYIAAGDNDTNYTWNHFDADISPYWQQIQTTITLNPQNGNAGGGTTALYTIAQNQDWNSASGVYLDSARTEPVTTNANPITAPTAPTATLTFNLNDSVAEPASFSYTPKTHYYYDGNNAVSQTCGQKYGITISNDGKTFTVPAQFNGYYSAASGGTQYIEKRNLPTGETVYFITQAGIDAGLAYSTDTTWYGQWEHINPIDACVDEFQNPSRRGYIFDGWWTAPSGGSRVTNPANLTIDSNTVLYAHWNLGTFIFAFDVNAGDAVLGTVGPIYEKYNTGWSTNENGPFSSTFTLSGAQLPTRPGYVFAGFTDAATNGNAVGTYSNGVWTAPAPAYDGSDTKAFYAQWTAATYNITYNYNGGTVGSSAVPAGYTQLEYIESTGTQYIDTGIKADLNTKAVLDFQLSGYNNNGYIFGSRTAQNTNAFIIGSNSGKFVNTTFPFAQFDSVGPTFVQQAPNFDLNRHVYELSSDGFYIDGILYTRYSNSTSFSTQENITLFGRYSSGAFAYGIYRLYSFKLYDGDILIRNFIPVRRNMDNEVGMYDTVSGTFFENAGTGSFTGPAVTTAYPTTYTYGTGTTIYGLPSRANSVFESWCRTYDSTNNTYSDCASPHEITTTDLGNKTVYAKWTCAEHYHLDGAGANESCEADVYTVTLDMNHSDASGYTNPTPTIYEKYNTGWATTNTAQTTFGALTLTGNQLPTRTGYTLTGFYDAASGGNPVGTFSNGAWTPPAANTYTAGATLYAQWMAATYNITYNYNGGTVGSSAVPAGYTRVEYIESDGNQIINTGVGGLYTRVVIDAQYTGTDNALDMLAGYDIGAYVGAYVGVYNKKWTLTESATGLTSVSALDRSNVSVVFDRDTNNNYYNRSTITVDGETVTATRSNFRDGNTLKLFNGRSSGASNGFVGRIYRAMIYKNDSDAVIFDGVPARRNSDNALGIYDTVSGTFLENVGTETFTAGADIATTYPATYTYGTGATVYGMPVRANSVFVGWCRDSALSIGCGMPHEIAGTTVGDVALYAKWDCVYGYSANAQTGQCELSTPMFTITTTQIEPGTVFKFNLGARGTFVVDWGDGTQPQIINSNTVADTQYTHIYAADAFGGMATKSFTIGFSGRGVEYSSTNTVSTIKFFNATLDEDGDIVSDDQGNPMNGSEFYIASISGSLGAMFPVIGNGGTNATTPSFYQTFRNAKNMSQTMASLADLFDGINGAPRIYMFSRTFQGCSGLTGEIPGNLFAGISGAPANYMFYATFYGCSGLRGSIPGNLFAGISGAPTSSMFRETFRGCSGLTGTIPENLFVGINGAPASYMFLGTFYGCSGLTGSIPENLFGRVVNGGYVGINGTPASYMFYGTFYGCSGLTGSIPENLFGRVVNGTHYGINGTPALYMFGDTFRGCSGLTGSIPGNLFGRVVNGGYVGINGAPALYMFLGTFYGCSGLTGSIPENLFGRVVNGTYYGISGAPKMYMFHSTFYGCSGLSGEIPSYLFGHISGNAAAYMFTRTFQGCSGLTGTIPGNLFGGQNLTGPVQDYAFYQTFYGCRNLSGYVPANLFGQMTLPATPPTGMMSYVFYNTGLETSCPCGTTQVTSSPFRTYWSGKVSCAPGLDVGQHWYNGQCTTMCSNSSIDELHVGSLSAFPILADKITTPSINVKYGDTVCYVPLVAGNGGTNSLNMSYGGNVYHADRPDDIAPTGFGQRD